MKFYKQIIGNVCVFKISNYVIDDETAEAEAKDRKWKIEEDKETNIFNVLEKKSNKQVANGKSKSEAINKALQLTPDKGLKTLSGDEYLRLYRQEIGEYPLDKLLASSATIDQRTRIKIFNEYKKREGILKKLSATSDRTVDLDSETIESVTREIDKDAQKINSPSFEI